MRAPPASSNPSAWSNKSIPFIAPLIYPTIHPTIHPTKSHKPCHPEAGVVLAELAMALGVLALGVLLLWGSSAISFGAGYDRIGPRFFPYAVAAGLILLGARLTVAAIYCRQAKQEAAAGPEIQSGLNWRPLGLLSLALLLNLVFLETAGFVIASSVQFWLVARAFHSRRPARDAVIAVLVSTIVYFAFSQVLGLTLPAGIFESLF
jgi:putative tricarboxylic transport membrane protein